MRMPVAIFTASVLILALGGIARSQASKPVDTARLTGANRDSGNWLMYGRTYDDHRFSSLKQINEQTIAKLGLFKVFQRSQQSGQPTKWETLMKTGLDAIQSGRHSEAVPALEAAIKEAETFGPETERLGYSLAQLAGLYAIQKRNREAEALFTRSLSVLNTALPPDHWFWGVPLSGLAQVYLEDGKYGEAEPLLRRSLMIREKALGPEDPAVAVNLNNLAVVYRVQEKYAEAEVLYRRALAIDEKAFGVNHPRVAATLLNYSALLRKTGRKEEADKMEARAKAIQRER